MTKHIAFAFDSRNGRRVEVGLDVKGVCVGPSCTSRDIAREAVDHFRNFPPKETTMTRAQRIAADQSLDSNDVLSLFKILLSGIAPEERDDFKAQLLDLLDAEQQPATDEPPAFPGRPRPGGTMYAGDRRLPRGVASFEQRFPNASKVGNPYSR